MLFGFNYFRVNAYVFKKPISVVAFGRVVPEKRFASPQHFYLGFILTHLVVWKIYNTWTGATRTA